MYILAIESSCDETGVAILSEKSTDQIEILSEELSSQVKLHELYGGVVPELASREHMKNLPLLLEKALAKSKISLNQITGIGVTRGPGLKGCLMTGLFFGHGLSQVLDVPLVGVNHIEGHLLAPMLDNPELKFPYLCLVVSGGHTEIHLLKGVGDYTLLCRTQDDAAGEAFDKSANLLGINYPGGAMLAALADSVPGSRYKLPKVMRSQEGFSFSGLKTAISLLIKKEYARLQSETTDTESEITNIKGEIAFAIQQAIIQTLIDKLKAAMIQTNINQVAISGGVAANKALRKAVSNINGAKTFFPLPSHSTDNAAMIAYVAYLRLKRGESLPLDAPVLPRWPVETLNSV